MRGELFSKVCKAHFEADAIAFKLLKIRAFKRIFRRLE